MTPPDSVAPEFSRPERVDMIGSRPATVTITADAAERAALAVRFGLVSVERLTAVLALQAEAAEIAVTGRVEADVVQACVITGVPLSAHVDEPVALRFVPEAQAPEGDEIELADDALDVIAYGGSAIDLGEAAAQTMALALEPFPRSPDAADSLRAAGVIAEEEAGPFGALAALRDKLKG